jgi:DNA-binding NarL/FixJ family response regulator
MRRAGPELDEGDAYGEALSAAVLSRRELEIVAHVARGLSNQAIASELDVSVRTVESHMGRVRKKLGLSARTQLVRWAFEHGLGPRGRG